MRGESDAGSRVQRCDGPATGLMVIWAGLPGPALVGLALPRVAHYGLSALIPPALPVLQFVPVDGRRLNNGNGPWYIHFIYTTERQIP